jgi:hypothetical protein
MNSAGKRWYDILVWNRVSHVVAGQACRCQADGSQETQAGRSEHHFKLVWGVVNKKRRHWLDVADLKR